MTVEDLYGDVLGAERTDACGGGGQEEGVVEERHQPRRDGGLADERERVERGHADDRQPAALFLWTWGGSVLANAVFLGRPLVALTGGVVMGLVAVPFARRLVR